MDRQLIHVLKDLIEAQATLLTKQHQKFLIELECAEKQVPCVIRQDWWPLDAECQDLQFRIMLLKDEQAIFEGRH